MKNRIHEIRTKAGLSMEALAQRIGTTRATIMKLEKGHMNLTTNWMERIAKGLGCSPLELISSARAMLPIIGHIAADQKITLLKQLEEKTAQLRDSSKKGKFSHRTQLDSDKFDMVEGPPGTDKDLVALRVKGDSLLPFLPSGSLLFLKEQPQPLNTCLNKLCMVKPKGAKPVLRILKRGYGYDQFNLVSLTGVITENAPVEWAISVDHISLNTEE